MDYYRVVGIQSVGDGNWRVTLRNETAVGVKTILVPTDQVHKFPADKVIVYRGEFDEARRGDPPGFRELFTQPASGGPVEATRVRVDPIEQSEQGEQGIEYGL